MANGGRWCHTGGDGRWWVGGWLYVDPLVYEAVGGGLGATVVGVCLTVVLGVQLAMQRYGNYPHAPNLGVLQRVTSC